MIESIDTEVIKADFQITWCAKVQQLVSLRRSKMTQTEIAKLTGRSLKTIQRFESYRVFDPELMFIYNKLLV